MVASQEREQRGDCESVRMLVRGGGFVVFDSVFDPPAKLLCGRTKRSRELWQLCRSEEEEHYDENYQHFRSTDIPNEGEHNRISLGSF